MPEGIAPESAPDAGQALWLACLDELARELPDAVNQATPSGQLPNDDELHRLVGG